MDLSLDLKQVIVRHFGYLSFVFFTYVSFIPLLNVLYHLHVYPLVGLVCITTLTEGSNIIIQMILQLVSRDLCRTEKSLKEQSSQQMTIDSLLLVYTPPMILNTETLRCGKSFVEVRESSRR